MPRYVVLAALASMIGLVLLRARQLKKRGIWALKFGEQDRRDFFAVPFALLFCYLLLAGAFRWHTLGFELFYSEGVSWAGAALCLFGVGLFGWALRSFGESFRVGIDDDSPGELVTGGAFALSRNPIYAAFGLFFAGAFLAVPNVLFVFYAAADGWFVHRQVLLEEAALQRLYGERYAAYCKRVRRYL